MRPKLLGSAKMTCCPPWPMARYRAKKSAPPGVSPERRWTNFLKADRRLQSSLSRPCRLFRDQGEDGSHGAKKILLSRLRRGGAMESCKARDRLPFLWDDIPGASRAREH